MYSYIFDIGGVLIQYDFRHIVKNILSKVPCEKQKVERLFTIELLYPVETGRITGVQFYEQQVTSALPELSYEEWVGFHHDYYELNPEGVELLQLLKDKGRDIYILSNLADFHKEAIERKLPGFFGLCKRNFFSYELGFHKPEKEIFLTVCEGIGKRPEECVFLDDMEANVEGARKAGLKGIHFSNERIAVIREQVLAMD